jgi:inner membrane transporter RhtA
MRDAGQKRLVPVLLLSLAASQVGAAFGATVVPIAGSFAIVAVRLAAAGIAMLLLTRPRVTRLGRAGWRDAVLLGLVMVVMNNAVYLAIGRIGVGLAITLEFVGPLLIALVASRTPLHVMSALLALGGVALIGIGPARVDVVGVIAALVGAAAWATYILVFRSVNARSQGRPVAGVAAAISAVVFTPIGLASAPAGALDLRVVLIAAAAGLLSSALPFLVDSFVIARIEARVYGVLMSSSPVFAVLAGWVIDGVLLAPLQWVAVLLVVTAGAGAVLLPGRRPPVAVQ